MSPSTFIYSLLLITIIGYTNAINLSKVKLETNFTISIYSTQAINGARAITQSLNDPKITYVGSNGDTVYALVENTNTSTNQAVPSIFYRAITGMNAPGGVVWYNDALFVAEKNQVFRFNNIDTRFMNTPLTKQMASASSASYSNWTRNDHHSLKGALAIKDGKLYIPIGSPCNHPKEDGAPDCGTNPWFGHILTMSTTTLEILEVVASGHRNSVGMDFSPKTGELWFTDNGRDEWRLPNNNTAQFFRPSDELNRMSKTGQNFGFPNCYGSGLTWESGGADEQYDWAGKDCRAADSPYTNSEWDVGAHTASLGLQFLSPTSKWPEKYQGSILIAQHGCWNCEGGNRGYQVIAVHLDPTGTRAIGQTSIADFRTFTQSSNGRPVDVQNMPDGISILVSDDSENLVYKITYTGATFTPTPTPTTAPSSPSSSSSSSSSTGTSSAGSSSNSTQQAGASVSASTSVSVMMFLVAAVMMIIMQ